MARNDATDCLHRTADYEVPFQPPRRKRIRGQVLEEVLRELIVACLFSIISDDMGLELDCTTYIAVTRDDLGGPGDDLRE